METFARSRTWRVAVVACLLVGLGSTADAQASTLQNPRPVILVRKSAEPFGLFADASSDGALRQKWLRLKQRFDDDMVQLALCDGDRDGCVSPPALRLLSIVDRARGRDGRARLGETNRAINLAIRATSDLAQYGEVGCLVSTDRNVCERFRRLRGLRNCESGRAAPRRSSRRRSSNRDHARQPPRRGPRGGRRPVRWTLADA
jgi:hypothetical protein